MGAAENIEISSSSRGPRLLDIAGALEYLNVHLNYSIKRRTLYNLLSTNQGPACEKRGGRLLFSTVELEAWVANNTRKRRAFGR